MAEEEKKEETKEEKKSSLVLIIVAVLIVLLLAIGGFVVYFMLSKNDQAQMAQTGTNQGQVIRKNPLDLTVGPMYPMEQFIVNLLSDGGRRYLKASINLELSGDELLEELDAKLPRIRDIVIRVLSSKTVEEISTPKGKDKLKQEINNQLNAVIVDGQVIRLYFTDFVVQ